jgi:hypothetical protein
MTEPTTRSPRDQFEEKEEDKKKKRLQEKKRLGQQRSNPVTSGPKKNIDTYMIIGDKEYKVENILKKAKGGRVGYKAGMKVCKLAKKGKGKAYGKNS